MNCSELKAGKSARLLFALALSALSLSRQLIFRLQCLRP
jgi:hypothetical protein